MPTELIMVAIAIAVTLALTLGGGAGLWKLISRKNNTPPKV